MHFVSATFLVFLIIILTIWHFLPYSKAKQALVLANFIFYGYWFPPFILLLLISGGIDFYCSNKIVCDKKPARYLIISLCANLGMLFVFKYFNFFIDSFQSATFFFGASKKFNHFNIILPMGISFYTFQSMSYTIDIYKKKLKPYQFLDFFLYLSFFPQLVAGPIVRAIDFLPQLRKRADLTLECLYFATYRICRGYFLKVVVSDNIAIYANAIFASDYEVLTFSETWFGAFFFGIQIFCDFAGYSDIAIGVSRLFGFRIMENFKNPYTSVTLQDFWRRWHISLSSWFRDYVYFPLGGSRISKLQTSINTMVVFITSGLWHGANWTFVIWGGVHGLGLLVERHLGLQDWYKHNPINQSISIFFTFIFVTFAWVPFRAESWEKTLDYWGGMFSTNILPVNFANTIIAGCLWMFIFLSFQAFSFLKEKGMVPITRSIMQIESWCYFVAILLTPGPSLDFIYFQF